MNLFVFLYSLKSIISQKNSSQKKEHFFAIFLIGSNGMKNNKKISNLDKEKIQFSERAFKTSADSGRSMVEMLGVLAIIAILIIAGIWGYKWAMTKHRANQVVSELNMITNQIKTVMETPRTEEYELTLGDPYDEEHLTQEIFDFSYGCGNEIGVKELCSPDETFFYETLDGVSKEVCQVLVPMTQYLPYLVAQSINEGATGTGADCIEGDAGNKIALVFDVSETATLEGGEDVSGDGTSDEQDCTNKPLIGRDGKCYSCDEPNSVDVIGMDWNCNVCENRKTSMWGYYCILSECTPDRPLVDMDGGCYSCEDPNGILVNDLETDCLSVCPNRNLGGMENQVCVLNAGCPDDKPLAGVFGTCHTCDDTVGVPVNSEEACSTPCSNRYVNSEYLCVSSSCPSDKPLQDYFGTCHSCDAQQSIDVRENGDNCTSACGDTRFLTEDEYCILSNCTGDTPLRDISGACHSCITSTEVNVEGFEDNCTNACGDQRYLEEGYCKLNCIGEEPLRDKIGQCYRCDEPDAVDVSGVRKNCANACGTDRTLVGDLCILSCTAEEPLMDKDGACHACDVSEPIDVTGVTENCVNACGTERMVQNDFCILPCPPETPRWNIELKTCEACPENFTWDAVTSTCISSNPNIECVTNAECLRGEYCWSEATCSNDEEVMTKSECRSAETSRFNSDQSSNWTMSSDKMNWWSAQRFCEAINEPTMMNIDTDGGASQLARDLRMAYGFSYNNLWSVNDMGACSIKTICLADGWVSNYKMSSNYGSAACKKKACTSHSDCSQVCSGGLCLSCVDIDSSKPYWNGKTCATCPSDKPKWNGIKCIACDSATPKWDGSSCVTCPDRHYWDSIDNDCMPMVCESPTPLMDTDGNCHSCTTADSINVTGIEDSCTDICNFDRYLKGNLCKLECSGSTLLRDTNGQCHSCGTDDDIPVDSSENCSVCGDTRQYKDGLCLKVDIKCTSNANCPGEYCWAVSKEVNGIEQMIRSECKALSLKAKVAGYDTPWSVADENLNWWNAQRFCMANNTPTMPTATDFNCAKKSGVSNLYCDSSEGSALYNLRRAYSGTSYIWFSGGRSVVGTSSYIINAFHKDENTVVCK